MKSLLFPSQFMGLQIISFSETVAPGKKHFSLEELGGKQVPVKGKTKIHKKTLGKFCISKLQNHKYSIGM
jgi:hypothetical protein